MKNSNSKGNLVMIILLFLIIIVLGLGGFSLLPYIKVSENNPIDKNSIVSQDNAETKDAPEKIAAVPSIDDFKIEKKSNQVIRQPADDSSKLSTEDSEHNEPEHDESEDLTISDYIISDSNSRELTESDLERLTLEELSYARNEIYARYGRTFKAENLQLYFSEKSWYEGIYTPEEFENISEQLLNKIEKKNANFIKEYEKSKKETE